MSCKAQNLAHSCIKDVATAVSSDSDVNTMQSEWGQTVQKGSLHWAKIFYSQLYTIRDGSKWSLGGQDHFICPLVGTQITYQYQGQLHDVTNLRLISIKVSHAAVTFQWNGWEFQLIPASTFSNKQSRWCVFGCLVLWTDILSELQWWGANPLLSILIIITWNYQLYWNRILHIIIVLTYITIFI